ncbi:MAG: glutamate racemase [Bacillota bacterium]
MHTLEIDKTSPIGVFDSGVGGISVLAELIKIMPREKYLYFGDSGNAPYGTRPSEEIKGLAIKAVRFLRDLNIKALVVACNTATSVAIGDLRREFPIPVVGMEPAIKPAVALGKQGQIVVMATPATLNLEKFHHLVEQFHEKEEIIPLPCPGLADLIEKGDWDGAAVSVYLDGLFTALDINRVSAVVLGCTHYAFIRPQIAVRLKPGVAIIDGNSGTARQLQRVLDRYNLSVPENDTETWPYPPVRFYSSGHPDMAAFYEEILLKAL